MLIDLPIKRIVPGQKLGSLMTTVEKVAVKPHLPDPCGFGTATLYWTVVAADDSWHVVRLVSFSKRCAVQSLMQTVDDGVMFFLGDTAQVPPRLLVPVLAHMLEHLGGSTMACRVIIQSDAAAGGGAKLPMGRSGSFRHQRRSMMALSTSRMPAQRILLMLFLSNRCLGMVSLVMEGWNLGWMNDGLAAKRDAGFLSKEMSWGTSELELKELKKTPAAYAHSNAMSHFWRSEMGLEGHASFKSA
eukprot:5732856-Amphidinium_carterae.1